MSTSAVEEGLWTVADVARYLCLSRSWVYQASSAGTLPCIRIGAAVRFHPNAIREWVSGACAAAKVVKLPGCR